MSSNMTYIWLLISTDKEGINFKNSSSFFINQEEKKEENAYLRPHSPRLVWGNFARLFSLMEPNLMTYYLLVCLFVMVIDVGFFVCLLILVCLLVC